MMLISPEEKEEVLKIFPKVKSPQCSSCGKVQDRLFHAGRGQVLFHNIYSDKSVAYCMCLQRDAVLIKMFRPLE